MSGFLPKVGFYLPGSKTIVEQGDCDSSLDRFIFLGEDKTVSVEILSDEESSKKPNEVLTGIWGFFKGLFWVPTRVRTISGRAITILVNRGSWAKRHNCQLWDVAESIQNKIALIKDARFARKEPIALIDSHFTQTLTRKEKIERARSLLRHLELPVPDASDEIWNDPTILDSLSYCLSQYLVNRSMGRFSHSPVSSGFHMSVSLREPGHTRGISYMNGRLYIHRNKLSQGDELVGQGGQSRVKKAICLFADERGALVREDVVRITPLAPPLVAEKQEFIDHVCVEECSDPRGFEPCLLKPSYEPSEDFPTIIRKLIKDQPEGIVRVIDYSPNYRGKYKREKYLQVQALYPKGDLLAQLTANEPLTLDQQKSLILSLLKGVFWLHDNQIIHRDLKPGNILLKDDHDLLTCHITDFDGSRIITDIERPDVPSGNRYYAPPESNRYNRRVPHDPDYDQKTSMDMWAVGAIISHILDGERSEIQGSRGEHFYLDPVEETLAKYAGHPLFPLLQGLLQFDPAQRISAERALELAAQAFAIQAV